jgi:hypothetical protein
MAPPTVYRVRAAGTDERCPACGQEIWPEREVFYMPDVPPQAGYDRRCWYRDILPRLERAGVQFKFEFWSR